jgi:hypothetical protein
MSDLQKSFAKAKLAGLPPMPPEPFPEEEEETDGFTELPVDHPDDDSSSASSASSTGTIKPTVQKKLFARPMGYISFSLLPQKYIITNASQNIQQKVPRPNPLDHVLRARAHPPHHPRLNHHIAPRLSDLANRQCPSLRNPSWGRLLRSLFCGLDSRDPQAAPRGGDPFLGR